MFDNGCNCGSDEACGHGEEPMSVYDRRPEPPQPSLIEAMRQVRTRAEADAIVTEMEDRQREYKFFVRVGMDRDVTDAAFANWNEARERLIGMLCGEQP